MIPEAKEKKLIENAAFLEAVKDTLDRGIDVKFTVTGMSMWPFFTSRRDSVTIKKCTFTEIGKGDIILLSPTTHTYLLHRVVKKTDSGFITAGDGNTFRDGFFLPENVIAKVVEINRKEKIFSVKSKKFLILSELWILLFPIRPLLLKILKRIAK